MNRSDITWIAGRATLGATGAFLGRLRTYGKQRVPAEGGVILALNHFSWIDIPLFSMACRRNPFYVAKAEAHGVPGLGQVMRAFGSFAVRRGESDREAVRRMREIVREGKCLGVFVEGTRQHSGVPGVVQPGASLIAVREDVPIVCGAIHGSQTWRVGNFARCTVAWGEPWRAGDMTRDEVSQRIEREIRTLWEWLVDLHGKGPRPWRATPPS